MKTSKSVKQIKEFPQTYSLKTHTHNATTITQDENNRFVTDAEKNDWNSKAEIIVATVNSDGLLSNTDKIKLDGIHEGANKSTASTINGNILLNGVETIVYTHPAGTNPHSTTKSDIGLENVDNTSDLNKPISSATQTALNLKVDKVAGKSLLSDTEIERLSKISISGNIVTNSTTNGNILIDEVETNVYIHPIGTNPHGTTKTDIGLSNVNNTSDLLKPISTATQTALDDKVDNSQVLTNVPLNAKFTDTTYGVSTTSANGLMSSTDKTKLDGVATGANNYVHPTNHSPSIIAQDLNNRFVTDAEKVTWNGKAETSIATTSVNGLMSAIDKTKLDAIKSNAEVNNISDINATDLTDSGDTTLHYHSTDRNRTNHTGTQLSATISDFESTVRATVLTGLTTTTNSKVTATDTALSALGKLQKQITDNLSTLTSHTGNTSNPHSVTKTQVGLGNVDNTTDLLKPISSATQSALDGKINTSQKGVANGVAQLDSNGTVPSSQLPSYVDDVLEYTSNSLFPTTGESGKIYLNTTTNLTYRWTGSGYSEISPSIALGETSSTAYAGDKGKATTDKVNTHIGDTVSHITSTERTNWNSASTNNHTHSNKATLDNTTASYTTTDKTKLSGIATGANNYTLPIASTVIGGVKSGTDITVDASGNVSINDDSHNHIVSNIDGLQTALDGKVDDSQVLTNVPAGAKFTDTVTTINSKTGAISKTDIVALGVPSQDTTYTVFTPTINGLAPLSGGGTTKYLRADGTWAIPPDTNTNTTYAIVTTSVNGLMSSTDKTKLDGIATSANNYTLPVASTVIGGVKSGTDITVDASGNVSVNDDSHNHVIANIDGLQTVLDGKVDDSQVLTNVPAGAKFTDTVYVHPANHSPSIITQDATNRFVTDTEKATWNGKATTSVATTTANGLMPSTDKVKLNAISTGANKVINSATNGNILIDAVETNVYTHPIGTNPHSTTKTDIGLSNVDNTSDTNKNVLSATKLTTVRSIFGKSFNGTADISGKASVYGTYVELASSKYVNGALEIRECDLVSSTQSDIGYAPQIGFHWGGRTGATLAMTSTGEFQLINQAGNGYNNLRVGTLFGNVTGNSSTASKLITPRTIALTGDVTGSVNFDGSGNVNITSTVVDDSHNHIIANVDGLQTALNGKVDDSQVLTNVPSGAKFTDTVYTHPTTHAPSIITQDASNRFVTDAEKAKWDGKQSALGFTPYNATNPSGYITSSGSITGSSNKIMSIDGDRNPNTKLPTDSPRSLKLDFVFATNANGGGTYSGLMTYSPWDGTSASTGSCSYQLSFSSTVQNGGIPYLSIRNGIDSTWNAWYRLATDSVATPSVNGLMSSTDKVKLGFISEGANKVLGSAKPGNILVDGAEVNIYTHPTGTNPHGTTKANVGLGSVDNTADSTKNVLSATKLTTARTIALTGDVSGSVSFNGSNNATITATVADDSHNHIINNVDGLATALANITNSINSIQIGGRNLLPGSDFEEPTSDGFVVNTNVAISLSTDFYYNGSKSFKIAFLGPNGAVRKEVTGDYLNMCKGKEVSFSFKIKGNGSSIGKNIVATILNSDSTKKDSEFLTLTANWQTMYVTTTIPTNATHFRLYIGFGSLVSGDVVYIDCAKLELGNKVTDWSPAPEDMAYKITSGIKSARPTPTHIGQSHFDTTLGKPIWCKIVATQVWVDSTGTTV